MPRLWRRRDLGIDKRYCVAKLSDAEPELRYLFEGAAPNVQARAVRVHRDHFATCTGSKAVGS